MSQNNGSARPKRIALVHDWLFHMRGGEKVLEAIAEIFPQADIYTLFLNRSDISPSLKSHSIKTCWFNWIPGIQRFYKWLLPLHPWLIERFNLKKYDLIISSSHCVAKGVRIPKGVPHICYCHTPVRYAWYFEREYFSRYKGFIRKCIHFCLNYLRKWDLESSKGVTQFIANSKNIANKIQDLYNKNAEIIHPPLDFSSFQLPKEKKDYYLVVSALEPYKRIDIAIRACSQLGKPLWVVGKGSETNHLKHIAGESIRFFNWVPDDKLSILYSEAKALIFPGEEDFGIIPLEAQASGTPVIAYAKGGVLETVRNNETGLFFEKQSVGSLKEAILKFESCSWDAEKIRRHAGSFSKERFQEDFKWIVKEFVDMDT
jgi:glycosyltransferase involved in cell wall biosynthesis